MKVSKKFVDDTQVLKLYKAFGNLFSANLKLLKTKLRKIRQAGGFLVRLLGAVLKTLLTLIGNVLKSLAKSVLVPLVLTVAASPTDAAIHKKMFRPNKTTLLICNEE